MNIKSLLLGSAAALVAVSGARAADAVVVAEPEPMEYVRVCDTYGVGFYYIPGTETCLRISGLLRYDIDFSEDDDFDTGLDLENGRDEGWAKQAYARLNIDARSETEYGTFRRFIRFSAATATANTTDNGFNDFPGVGMEYAYIELGGLLVGLYDTLYDGDLSPEFDSAGGTTAHQIRYTWNGANGIQVAASLEEQSYNTDDYVPNLVGNVGITQGWGSVRGWVAYDSITEEVGLKGIVSFSATDAITLQALATYETGTGDFSVGTRAHTGYEWSLAGAVGYKVSDKLSIWGGGQYFADSHVGSSDDYRIAGQVDYLVVENLLARAQVFYNGGDDQDSFQGKFRLESSF